MTIGADPAVPEAASLTYDQGVLREIARRVLWLSAAIVDAANAGRAWEPAFAQDLEWCLLHAMSRVGVQGGTSSCPSGPSSSEGAVRSAWAAISSTPH
jgi:hypothetical protein